MRSDRELLELAAKAAGINARWFKVKQWERNKDRPNTRFYAGTQDVFGTHHSKPWNPLADDGDALRLAVKLEMDIFFNDGDTDVMGSSEGGGDPFARTRRAIVRAAAEIGAQVAEPAHNEIGEE